MSEKRIEKEYEKAFSQLGEIQPIFPVDAKAEMAKMVEEIFRRDENLASIVKTNQSNAVKGGLAAEEALVETRNLNAILQGKESRAFTSRDSEWSKTGLKGNDPVVDIAGIDKDGNVSYKAQSKFYKTADDTAKEMRVLNKDGVPKYQDAEALIGPDEQISDIISASDKTARFETAKGRTQVADAARNTADKATGKVDFDGASGKSFTKKEAEKIGSGSKEGEKIKQNYRDERQTALTLKHMKQAAVGAAAISAVASGVFNTFTYCKMVKEGKITESEAVIKIAAETACSAADSAIKASVSVGLQSTLIRYSTKEGIKLIANNSVRSLLRTNVATVGVICGIDVIKDLVRLGTGKIDKRQFEERNSKNFLNTSAGMMGGSVGFKIASSFALSGKLATAATLTGGIAGGLIAGLAMQFAIENHIEKPYKELVSNTVALTESMQMFQQVSENVFKGQVVFAAFLEKERQLDVEFGNQAKRIQATGDRMKKAIDML